MISENVKRGIALLDEKHPGWEREINIENLNLSSYEDCMLGQLFERQAMPSETPYDAGLRILGLELGKFYGFVGDTRSEWVSEIKIRREVAQIESIHDYDLAFA